MSIELRERVRQMEVTVEQMKEMLTGIYKQVNDLSRFNELNPKASKQNGHKRETTSR